MNKKIILILVLAGILAMLSAIAILRLQKNPESIKQVQPAIEEVEKEITPIQESAPVEISEPESKPVVEPVKQVSYKKPTAQKPEINVQKIEAPVIKPIVVEETEPINEEPIPHENVYQEEGSKDIVITREYKTPTQARYSFK